MSNTSRYAQHQSTSTLYTYAICCVLASFPGFSAGNPENEAYIDLIVRAYASYCRCFANSSTQTFYTTPAKIPTYTVCMHRQILYSAAAIHVSTATNSRCSLLMLEVDSNTHKCTTQTLPHEHTYAATQVHTLSTSEKQTRSLTY